MIIYKVTNINNGKVYIGKTEQELKQRRWSHYNSARNLDSNTNFHRALRNYSKKYFQWEIIKECSSIEELNKMEEHFISEYNSFKFGYNMTEGGDGGHTYSKGDELYNRIKHKLGKWKNGNPGATKDAIEKRKETFKNTKWVKGENHGNYGHTRNRGKYKGGDNPNAKPVIIDGIEYATLVSAAKSLNVTESYIRYRCKSQNEKYKQYKYKF
jgi:group I intron endonuclease